MRHDRRASDLGDLVVMTPISQTAGGQSHDRFDSNASQPPAIMASSQGRAGAEPVEITAVQKMLSATTGSLLTGLLGGRETSQPIFVEMQINM